MVTFTIHLLSVAMAAYHLLGHVACTPIEDVHSPRNAPLVQLKTNTTPTTPSRSASHWVIYSDQWVGGDNGPPDPSAVKVCAQPAVMFLRHRTLLIPLCRVSIRCEFLKRVWGVCLTRVVKYSLILDDFRAC
jgi:hypothetical protein